MRKFILRRSLFVLVLLTSLQLKVSGMSVMVDQLCASWCGQPTGQLSANVTGGVAPYTFSWDMGASGQMVIGLFTGIYTVTVTDNTGNTAVGTGIVDDVPYSPFYLLNLNMPNAGQNNGTIEFGLYTSLSGYAWYLPPSTINIYLNDSTGINIIDSYSQTCTSGNCSVEYYTFDSLPPGLYTVTCELNPGGCYTSVTFRVKEIPDIYPSYSTAPSCNGSPTGRITVNTHPAPSLNPSTFNANATGTTGQSDPVFTAYKSILYDALNAPVRVVNTRDSLINYYGLTPGTYQLKIYTGDTIDCCANPYYHDSTLVYSGSITVTSDPTCSYVQGKLFADANSNCLLNLPNDRPLQGTLIELNPGGFSATTDANGDFYIPIPNGTYTLKQYSSYEYAQLCPDTNSFSIVNTTPGSVFNVTIADSITVAQDISVGIVSNATRPGLNTTFYLYYHNKTPNYVPAQTLVFEADPNLVFNSAGIPPSSVNVNQYTWNLNGINAFGTLAIPVTFTVPVTTPIGTVLTSTALLTTASGETYTTDNADTVLQTVTGSYDPNDKSVFPTGYGNEGYISAQQELKYTIRFQNTGNDTAFNIVVVDTLPPSLDKYTLSVLNASHPYWYEFKPGNAVAFHFNNILLPDSGSNEAGSHGAIKFSIQQTPGNPAGTVIENSAQIYFDFNTPVATNSIHNTVFDCNSMTHVTVSDTLLCEGETLFANAGLLFPMTSNWYFNSAFISGDSSISINSLTAGTYSLVLEAINSTCSQNVTTSITINPLPAQPTFTLLGNQLTSSAATGNQWIWNGTALPGATGTTYTVTTSGYYSVIITDLNGCTRISDSTFISLTGLNQQPEMGSLFLSPNPAGNTTQITNFPFHVHDEILISDVNGKVQYRKTVITEGNNEQLDIGGIASGIYFVRIVTEKGIFITKMLKR